MLENERLEQAALKYGASNETISPAYLPDGGINGGERPIVQGERHKTLMSIAGLLQRDGVPDAGISNSIRAINTSNCIPPLDDAEIESILSSVLSYEKGQTLHQGRFDHSVLGDLIISQDHAAIVEGAPMVWLEGRYQMGHEAVDKVISIHFRQATSTQRKEVFEYLKLFAPKEKLADPRYIAFQNGILDIETMELLNFSSDLRIPNIIPHDWNPEARCDSLDNALNDWACNRADVRANLEEVIGMCLYRGREIGECPLLIGEGANGKSSYLNFLIEVIGEDNICSMELATIGKHFQTANLVGKLANIGDDISNEFVRGNCLATVKKVITGDSLSAERKYGASFSFRPYCTLVFSCNDVPRLGDTSEGVLRRLAPIPFDNTFRRKDQKRNPRLSRELASEAAYERAICLGIIALRRCLERGGMTLSASREQMVESIKVQNSSVYDFIVEALGYNTDEQRSIIGVMTQELFDEYTSFCYDAKRNPVYLNRFTSEICKYFGVDHKRHRHDTSRGRVQVSTFMEKENPSAPDSNAVSSLQV